MDYIPNSTAHSKSVDDNDPIPMNSLPRGYGGVSTVWEAESRQPKMPYDGSNRMVVTETDDFILINIYLPCRGSYTNTEFQAEVDKLTEICEKYSSSKIILVGDFNVDIGKCNDSRVKYLKKTLASFHLSEALPLSSPTFRHHNGQHKSKIDYIFLNDLLREKVKSVVYRVLEHDPANVSTHEPLLLKIEMEGYTSDKKKIPPKRQWIGKPLWHKCDPIIYENALAKCLETEIVPSSPDLAIDYLTKCIVKTTKEHVPFSKFKPKKKPWNPHIAKMLKESKKADAIWKEAEKPPPPSVLFEDRKIAKKRVRSAQRVQAAISRLRHIEILNAASSDNSNLFYSIIKRQRKSQNLNTKELFYNGILHTDDLLHVWQSHFSSLATPSIQPNFTMERFDRACTNIKNISNIIGNSTPLTIPITLAEVKHAMKILKKKKAKDGASLTAEHLQAAIQPIAAFLTPIINQIIGTSYIPRSLKEGIQHPIQKKGKDILLPGNYRGITISALIGKVMDYISLQHQRFSTPRRLHPLQFGFTEEKSGTHAAFILNEAIAETKDKGLNLYAASLDVQKAFDVVRQESLLDKLYEQGLTGRWWKLKEESYGNRTGKVLWDGELSDSFKILQGNQQGAYPSPDDYLSYLVQNLENLSLTHLGLFIGTTNICSPTCADDMLILATSMLELQILLNIVTHYANQEHYVIHPEKSLIMPFNIKSAAQLDYLIQKKPWEINGSKLPVMLEMTHIGILRNHTGIDPTIENRISLGRATLYSLMGAGLHGLNGLPVPTSCHIYKTYVLPRVTYGLECLKLRKDQIAAMEIFHRSTLRSLLGLPDRTAIPALHILTGILPLESIIDQKSITFLHALIKKEGSTRNIIERQYSVKKESSNSWIIYIKKILQKYSLPCISDILESTPTKIQWKHTVKKAIIKNVTEHLKEEAASKSTLRYLNPTFNVNETHHAVAQPNNPREVTRSNIRIRLLTGTYTFQSSQQTFGKVRTDICQLCGKETEDICHFLLRCTFLSRERIMYIKQIDFLIPYVYLHRHTLTTDHHIFTQLLLDPSHPTITSLVDLNQNIRNELDYIATNLCFKLHTVRAQYLISRR